ncbi:putative transcriptional regulatory protein [Cyphellophora attinorum]|uniref:Putative transcriptional regulatory protein n=1 Tax=Cyphellophora attinorum TaxID=1664694 RepID=A0A0N1H5P4_9EURO|nr:putative transcriptional regulatory protein [Phialophora attinorum]KPI41135.1 putative transcriptional regulatory protein [Phialophora attinorum]
MESQVQVTHVDAAPPVENSALTEKREKPRHRASVACTSCREKRTRCVIPPGEEACTQCKLNNRECVVNHDDERRKPSSKAYMTSLTERITQLENQLRERDQRDDRPTEPVAKPPESSAKALLSEPGDSAAVHDAVVPQPPSISSLQGGDVFASGSDLDGVSPKSVSSYGGASMVSKLLSSSGHLSFDQLSGRLRYFGPVANCHVHVELKDQTQEANRKAMEQQRRAEKALRSISMETHDYLLGLFWEYYNCVIHVVHRAAFEEGMEAGRGPYYSGFLHLCILAAGYKFCDKERPDMQKIALPDKESTLQREAKYMLEYEIERPGGIPSITALLILGDLETGSGRDNLGWLYAGMANRLCFDIGLHLDASNTGASQRDIEIGRMTLWACIIYDKYWALFLGRPTMMKPSDLEVYRLSVEFERMGTSLPSGPAQSRETQVYEALLDLMELAGKITEIMDSASKLSSNIDHHVYFRMSALHRELESWYSRLPEALAWNASNISTAPFSFFLLHQQYSATLILLHRPFARYDDAKTIRPDPDAGDSSEDDLDAAAAGKVMDPTNHFSALSRTICTQHAVRIAKIFWQHRTRFDTRRIFVTGLQHAGTAATALVAALAYVKDRGTRNSNMQYLECLAAALQDMSHTYVPAEKMSNVLAAVIIELRDAVPEPRQKPPRRRRSSHHENRPNGSFKRHQSFHHDETRNGGNDFRHSASQSMLNGANGGQVRHDHVLGTQQPQASKPAANVMPGSLPSGSDGWTMVGSSGADSAWSGLAQHTNFDEIANNNHESAVSSTQTGSDDVSGQVNLSNSVPHGLNFTQYRSNNAWMGAETPNMGFSTPPLTTPFSNPQGQRSQPRPAAMHEIQDLTFPDFVGLLNPDDRLDFGSLGMPAGLGAGFDSVGLDTVHSEMETDQPDVNDDSRLYDGNTMVPPAKVPSNIGSELHRTFSQNGTHLNSNFSGPYGPTVGNFSRSRSQSEVDSRTFSKTMAGLADILRRGTEGR